MIETIELHHEYLQLFLSFKKSYKSSKKINSWKIRSDHLIFWIFLGAKWKFQWQNQRFLGEGGHGKYGKKISPKNLYRSWFPLFRYFSSFYWFLVHFGKIFDGPNYFWMGRGLHWPPILPPLGHLRNLFFEYNYSRIILESNSQFHSTPPPPSQKMDFSPTFLSKTIFISSVTLRSWNYRTSQDSWNFIREFQGHGFLTGSVDFLVLLLLICSQ